MRSLVCMAVAVALTGCASISDPEAARGIAADTLPDMPETWVAGKDQTGSVELGWIAKLNDPVLTGLVDEAIGNNRNLIAAAGAVDESRALARQAGAALVPAVDVTASAARRGVINRSSTDFYTLDLRLGWEIDIWGRVRATQRTAAFSAYSAEADFLFTQYSIAASVARAYFLVIEAGLQLDVARKSLNALERTNKIVNVQLDNGVATGLDVALSQRDLANARDSVIDAEGAQRLAIRSLEVLLGRYPGALLDSRPELPATPPPPPAGLPSSLLQRRPDLIAAELSVAAAFNNVRAAQAARLPTISLTSTLGGSSTELADVLDPENVAWQVAGNLVGPLFDGGLRQSAVDQGRAQQQQAAAGYAQAALDAFQEVETSLDQNEVLRAREEVLKQAATQANRAFELAQLRYQEGETDLLDVLTIQSTAFAADSALVTVQRALLEEWINLNLALGGDWETAP